MGGSFKEVRPVGNVVEETPCVADLTNFGLLRRPPGDGIEGMIHISDITREKLILDHPREALSARPESPGCGRWNSDQERRRIKLGDQAVGTKPAADPSTFGEHYRPAETCYRTNRRIEPRLKAKESS